MSKEAKVARLIALIHEVGKVAEEIDVLSLHYDQFDGARVHFAECSFPLEKGVTTEEPYGVETKRHVVTIEGVEVFYLTDWEEETSAVI